MTMIRFQLFVSSILLSAAAPVSNEEMVRWAAEPKTRGTAGIIFSCVVTLGLCVWTALHLNIERAGKTEMAGASRIFGKMIWAFTALIAPELVLSIALHQFLVALEYCSIVNHGKNDHSEGIPLKTAFYAVMGGFAVKMTEEVESTLTLEVDMLVKTGTMEKIRRHPTAAIDDKSKADYLAKVLACFQAGWILFATLGRKLHGLPITLLELNTVVHVLNAVFMYGLWWKKPVDVAEPTIIDRFEESEKPTAWAGAAVLQRSLQTVAIQFLPLLRIESISESNNALMVSIQIAGELENTLHFVAGEVARTEGNQLDVERLAEVMSGVRAAKCIANICNDLFSSPLQDALRSGSSNSSTAFPFSVNSSDNIMNDFGSIFGDNHSEMFAERLHTDLRSLQTPYTFAKTNIYTFYGAFKHKFSTAFPNAFHYSLESPASASPDNHHSASPDDFPKALRNAFRNTFRKAFPDTFRDAFTADPSDDPRNKMSDGFIRTVIEVISPDLKVISPDLNLAYHGTGLYAIVAAREALFGTVCDAIRSNKDAIEKAIESGNGEKANAIFNTTLEAAYNAKFKDIRQQVFKWARKNRESPARDAAYKAAFHLNPQIVVEKSDTPTASNFWHRLWSTLSLRLITNQIIRVPGLFEPLGTSAEEGLGRRWCSRHRLIILTFSGFSSVFYGGMHSTKWYEQFPSERERSLWRISSCIGVTGIFPIMAFSSLNFTRHRFILYFICQVIGVVTGSLFVVARSYLIVESFLSMRAIPKSAYETVQWAEFIPHI